MKRKMTVLYLDEECAEVVRFDYRKYSKLEMDFIFCGGTDEELRRRITRALSWYIVEAKSKAMVDYFLLHATRPPYTVPAYFSGSEHVGVGKTLITVKLRSNIIDRIINEGGVVDIVKEWCEKIKQSKKL